MLEKILLNILPPVIPKAVGAIKSRLVVPKDTTDMLFDGDDQMFKEIVVGARTYAEYGCGASTIWVANNARCAILGVDSSKVWLGNVRKGCADASLLSLHHCDMGKVGDWGRPNNYDRWENFADYTDWIWKQEASPDVVLVDGRFRVCCFLTSLMNAGQGAQILFDDYMDRPAYHFVERFLKPTRTCGRQALFLAPGREGFDAAAVSKAIDQFRFVMD
jgi:hypothetical protein